MQLYCHTSAVRKRTSSKKRSFVVVNDGDKNNPYIKGVLSALYHNSLVPEDETIYKTTISHGDVIVVGDQDATLFTDFDYRHVPVAELEQLTWLDGRSYKVFAAVKDFAKVVKAVESYAAANYGTKPENVGFTGVVAKAVKLAEPKKKTGVQVNVNVQLNSEEVAPVFKAKDISSYKVFDPATIRSKVTFFADYVKVGLHQFDILHDTYGNTFIEDARKTRYYVQQDRFGRRLLVTR